MHNVYIGVVHLEYARFDAKCLIYQYKVDVLELKLHFVQMDFESIGYIPFMGYIPISLKS